MRRFITNYRWREIYTKFITNASIDKTGYAEAISFSFDFNPVTDYKMSTIDSVFNVQKAAKMFFWYKTANPHDASIIDYFPEYKHCVDKDHNYFNSNYGRYAYDQGGLRFCVNELKKNHASRRACFCINNNEVALNDSEIDKLCTNTIHFFIRDAKLHMVVQMRSSNFATLLPYDAFMFSVFYYEVYKALKTKHKILMTGTISMQIASLHLYEDNVEFFRTTPIKRTTNIDLLDFTKDLDYTITQLNKSIQ